MKLKDKIKSYSFWVSIASAVILILKVLGTRFNFVVDESMVSDIFTALCSVLVLLGIIVVPNSVNSQTKTSETNDKIDNFFETKSDNITDYIFVEEKTTKNEETKAIVEEDNNSAVDNTILNIEETIVTKDDNCLNNDSYEEPKLFNDNYEQNNFVSDNNSTESSIQTNNSNAKETIDFRELFENNKEKFSGNLNEYLLYLQEEIKKLREKM